MANGRVTVTTPEELNELIAEHGGIAGNKPVTYSVPPAEVDRILGGGQTRTTGPSPEVEYVFRDGARITLRFNTDGSIYTTKPLTGGPKAPGRTAPPITFQAQGGESLDSLREEERALVNVLNDPSAAPADRLSAVAQLNITLSLIHI